MLYVLLSRGRADLSRVETQSSADLGLLIFIRPATIYAWPISAVDIYPLISFHPSFLSGSKEVYSSVKNPAMSPSAVNGSQNGTNQHLTDTAVAKALNDVDTKLVSDNLAEKKSSNGTSHAGLDASLLTIERSQKLQDMSKAAPTGCTDHMITCQWTLADGWQAPKLVPFGPFSIMPNASVFHCQSDPSLQVYTPLQLLTVSRRYRMFRRLEGLSRL